MMQSIRPTSKTALKMQCLWACNGDLAKAKEFYDYFAKDTNLQDNDPVPTTWQPNTANTINSIMSWLKENQDTLAQGYSFIQSVIANRGALPTIAAETESALPEINA